MNEPNASECDSARSSPVTEDFSVQGDMIIRSLSVNGSTGQSAIRLIRSGANDVSTQGKIWEQAYLRAPVERISESGRKVTVADVFCGCGGLSYGVNEAIQAAGMTPFHALAIDIDPIAMDVHRRNLNPLRHSLENLWASVTTNYVALGDNVRYLEPPKAISDDLRESVGKIDILLGAPPCEGHSTSNNVTLRRDERNKYYVLMPSLAIALEAKAVVIENVPGIVHDSRRILDHAVSLFEQNDYLVDQAVINATDLGLPQTRRRHVLIASRTRQPDIEATLQEIRRPKTDLWTAIGDLEDVEADDIFDSGGRLSKENVARIDYLFDNDTYDLDNAMRPRSHRKGHTYPAIYGRLHWDRPSGTITTGFNTPGRGRYVHPSRRRTITPHEAARIQGFPDSFEFKMLDGSPLTRAALGNIIGNAVPPQIGYAAGVAALATLP